MVRTLGWREKSTVPDERGASIAAVNVAIISRCSCCASCRVVDAGDVDRRTRRAWHDRARPRFSPCSRRRTRPAAARWPAWCSAPCSSASSTSPGCSAALLLACSVCARRSARARAASGFRMWTIAVHARAQPRDGLRPDAAHHAIRAATPGRSPACRTTTAQDRVRPAARPLEGLMLVTIVARSRAALGGSERQGLLPPTTGPRPPTTRRGARRRPEREHRDGRAPSLKADMPHYTWAGIYLLEGDELVLGPYRVKPSPHTRIPLGRGICGAAASQKQRSSSTM